MDLKWENTVSMLTRSFLIESSSKFLVTRIGIKARISLILGRIRLLTDEEDSNLNISEASWPILIKLYMWHHWWGGEGGGCAGVGRLR